MSCGNLCFWKLCSFPLLSKSLVFLVVLYCLYVSAVSVVMYLASFLKLIIGLFYLVYLLVSLEVGWVLCKELTNGFIDFSLSLFLFYQFHLFVLFSLIFHFCFTSGWICSSFSWFLRLKLWLLVWDFFSFLIYAISVICFPLGHCYSCIPQVLLCCIFIFIHSNVFFSLWLPLWPVD